VTAQRASRIAGGVALVAVLSVVGMVTWSLLNRSDPGPALPLAEGPALGDMTGYVGRVDPLARTVDVTEDLLGLRPVMLAVTDDTSIMVHGKQGGLGDLSKDMPVRVFYEVRNDVKYVTSIQVITADATPVAEARPVAPAAVVSASQTTPSPAPAPPLTAATPPPTPPPPTPASPPRRAPDPSPAGQTARRSPPPRVAAPATEAASPPVSVTRPAETEAGDGSAAVDWLFESRRR
jgi:hypothetical protein